MNLLFSLILLLGTDGGKVVVKPPVMPPYVVNLTTTPKLPAKSGSMWTVNGAKPPGFKWTTRDKNAATFTVPADTKPCSIDITWTGAEFETGVQHTVDLVATIGDAPIPDPPGPKPPVPPIPVTGPAWAVVVEQTEQRTPSQAAILGNFAMWKNLTDKGHMWRIYDADNSIAKTKGFVEAANSVGLPALLIVGNGGKLISMQKLPETSAGVEEAMKKATGL